MNKSDEKSDLALKDINTSFSGIIIVIPSLNPDGKLIAAVRGLRAAGFKEIILVNDGSAVDYCLPFSVAESEIPYCTVLKHEINRGKGAALKTAFEFVINNRPESIGVITVDGDGQHSSSDVVKLAKKLLYYSKLSTEEFKELHDLQDRKKLMQKRIPLIIGTRDFSGRDVPRKSRIGNRVTSGLFKAFFNLRISDTQTGLRAIAAEYLPLFLTFNGDRYEYETNMLLECGRRNIPIEEVSISTVYIDDNLGSHFNPVRDSLRIYGLILKFMFSSVVSTMIDYAVFNILLYLFDSLEIFSSRVFMIMLITAIARLISSLCNFHFNYKIVFSCCKEKNPAIMRYYSVCIPQMIVSGLLVSEVSRLFGGCNFMVSIIKIIVDVFLFFISFRIQHRWVFKY